MSTPYKNLTDQGTNTNVPPPQAATRLGLERDTTADPGARVNTVPQHSGDIGWPNPDPNPGPKPMRLR